MGFRTFVYKKFGAANLKIGSNLTDNLLP